MVHLAMPPVSRRMASTPPSISVKFVRFEKNLLTASNGALTSILPLNDERTRNISQLAMSGEQLKSSSIVNHASVGEPPLSSNQQRAHQRCFACRSASE